jgi:hypothetical protein
MTVSLVPRADDVDVFIVLDQLRTHGTVWRAIDEELADEAHIVEWIINGEFDRPLRVVSFNVAEGWARDVTEDIARKLLDMSRQGRVLGTAAVEFVERITGQPPMVIV